MIWRFHLSSRPHTVFIIIIITVFLNIHDILILIYKTHNSHNSPNNVQC